MIRSTAAVLLVVTVLPVPACRGRARPAVHELPARVDLAALHARYGESRYSQDEEETLVRAFFQDRRGGVFLDVGAGDPVDDSTTYYLEKHLGWTGIAVDAQAEYAERWRLLRPSARFFTYFVADRSGPPRAFYVAQERAYSSATPSDPRGGRYTERQVPTLTLNELLAAAKIDHVDFVSMDIEGAEPLALAGFDIDRYRPELVCIEVSAGRHARSLNEYFTVHGYREITAYRTADPVNRYYARAAP